jgi:PAS domain S-box-containing protein
MSKSDYRYELFFELSPDLLCIAGYDGYFRKVNPAVPKTLGYSFEELYSRPINDFVHPDHKDVTEKVRNELTRAKPLLNFENKYLTKGGETVWLSWTSYPVEEESVIFAIAKNITHKKRQEADRNALLAGLTKMNRDLVQLNFTTSEDLRSPVQSLLALFELMDFSRIGDQETIQLLEVLQYAGEKVKRTLNSHDDLLRKSNRLDLEVSETDLKECLDQVAESITTLIHTSKATILTDFSKVTKVRFNSGYLKSIYLNLITNAIKYARPDSLPVISIYSQKNIGRPELVISDNGAGFDAIRMREEISSFPHKFDSDPNSKGIGLYLLHNQVSALGGEIKIESEPGQGTTVTITFKP